MISMKIRNIVFLVILSMQTQKSSGIYQKMIKGDSWPKALSRCQNLEGFFVPDLGKEKIIRNILPQMKKEETVWLNAKEIILEFYDKISNNSVYRYLKMSHRPVASFLNNYLCGKADINTKITKSTWHGAQKNCIERGGVILSVYPNNTKYARHHLKESGEPHWIGKYREGVLPTMDSIEEGLAEMCIGIMKESKSTFQYRAANCTEDEYKYFCDVSLNVSKKYAPTIQELFKNLPEIMDGVLTNNSSMKESHISEKNKEDSGETTDISVIVGPAVAGGLVILIIILVIVIILKKRKSQRRYKKRWKRYQNGRQRQNIGTIQHINPDGTLESSTSTKGLILKDEQGGKYAHLCEGTSGQREQLPQSKTHNIDQPGYYFMDATSKKPTYINKKAELEVVPCYETYDPDPVELDLQIQNRNDGKIPIKLRSDLPKSEELKKGLMMSEMKQRIKSQNDLDRDERSCHDNKPPTLPTKNFKSPIYTKPIKDKMAEKQTNHIGLPVQKKKSITQEPQMDTPKCLDDLDQYDGVSVGGPQNLSNGFQRTKMQNTQDVQDSLVDLSLYESFGQEVSSAGKAQESEGLNAPDQYENFDLPINKFPNEKSIPKSQEDTQSQLPQVPNLADLDEYENLKYLQIPTKKTTVSLENSNTYTDYPLCTTVKI